MADGLRGPRVLERAISYGWHPASHIKTELPRGFTCVYPPQVFGITSFLESFSLAILWQSSYVRWKLLHMSSPNIETFQDHGLWIARVETQFGTVEFLCGEGDVADPQQIAYLTAFLEGDYLEQIRKSAFTFSSFWLPIRFAVNDKGRMGVQFRNRLTGAQKGMYFADEHSSFSTLLSDI